MISHAVVEKDAFASECRSLLTKRFQLKDMFVSEGDPRQVTAVFRNRSDYSLVSYHLNDEIVSLGEDIPYSVNLERRMADMSGVKLPYDADPIVFWRRGNGYPMQKDCTEDIGETVPMPRNSTIGDDVFEIPVGPVHAGIIEPGHFRFSVAGEPVIELNPRLGYTHRGVEKLMEVPVSSDMSRLVERISGDTCVANCIAYSEIMEHGQEIPIRAKHIRTMLAEMERLYNHIGSIAGVCTDTAFTVPSAIGGGIQEKLMRLNLSLTKHRQLMNVVVPGGIRRDIPDGRMQELDNFMLRLKFEVQDLFDMITQSPAILDRLETTGVLTLEKAKEIGACGPIARSSGSASDVRKEVKYEMYGDLGMNVITRMKGDVYARTEVRLLEITESISLVHQCIQSIEPGDTRIRVTPEDGIHSVSVEAPRGELVHTADIRGGRIWRYSIRDPSFLNWFGMCHAVPGNVVPDFPLINKSFGLSYSGNDL